MKNRDFRISENSRLEMTYDKPMFETAENTAQMYRQAQEVVQIYNASHEHPITAGRVYTSAVLHLVYQSVISVFLRGTDSDPFSRISVLAEKNKDTEEVLSYYDRMFPTRLEDLHFIRGVETVRAFFVHQVMWDGWVEPETSRTYIIGHWNYPANTTKPIYVVSTGNEVELFLNGKSLGKGKPSYRYLFTFDNIPFEPGTLEAVASDGSRYQLETVGEPCRLQLTAIENPEGTKADGADMVLFQVEVLDRQGRRCPLDNRLVQFELTGEANWIGGIATRNNQALQRPDVNRPEGLLDAAATKNVSDNYVGAMSLPVECGVNRVLIRTTKHAGNIRLVARAEGLNSAEIIVNSEQGKDLLPQLTLKGQLDRGETPFTPSYAEQACGVNILSAKAGYDSEHASRSFDDNELSEWKNDGRLSTAWITYKLERKTVIDDICMKLTGWRLRSYPLEVYAGKTLLWSGETERSLGYIHLKPSKRVKTDEITIRLKGAGKDKDAFGGITEVAEPTAGELDLFKSKNGGKTNSELRIVEIEFMTSLQHL